MGEEEQEYTLAIIPERGLWYQPYMDCYGTAPNIDVRLQSEPRTLRIGLKMGDELGSNVGLTVDMRTSLGPSD